MGTNQPGEVARLRAIVEPNITVVTSVAEEHLEGLGDLAGVMREELAAPTASTVAIVPASQPEVVDAARSRARRVVAAGLDAGDLQADGMERSMPDGRGSLDGRRRRGRRCRCAALTTCETRCWRSRSRESWACPSTDAARGIAAMARSADARELGAALGARR